MSNLYISEIFWKKLLAEQKHLIKDSALQAMTAFEGLTLWGGTVWGDYFKKKGVEVYVPNDEEMKVWKDTLHNHMVEWTKKQIGPEWVDKFMKASQEAEKELYQ